MSSSQVQESHEDYEEIVEEIEYEDESSAGVETSVPPPTTETPAPPALATPPEPGKVKPSEDVKNMKMSSPDPVKKDLNINKSRNPFPTYGNWSAADINAITIDFPVLSSKNETTNELTRKSRPEARYWRSPVNFRYSIFSSTTIRINGVGVPFHTSNNYGTNFLYVSLPKHFQEAFSAAGKSRAPTRVTETSLLPTNECWWKIVNKVEGKVGVISSETSQFIPKSIATVMEASQNGMIVDMIVSVDCKASTESMEPLKATTIRTVSLNLVRAFIKELNQNVPVPARTVANKSDVSQPKAAKSDVASDDLMRKLAELGL